MTISENPIWAYDPKRKGDTMSEPQMKKVRGDGIQIQMAQWGEAGKPILCLHGITANCRCWDNIAIALASHCRVMAVDLRGRGGSDKPPTGYSIDHHCQDILAILDALGLQQVVLMGHSLGAFISLIFTARYPQRVDRLILVDGGGKLSEAQRAKVFAGIKPALDRLGQVFPSSEAYVNKMKEAPYLQPWNDFQEKYVRYEMEEVAGGVRTNIDPKPIEEESLNFARVDPSLFYGQIPCPTLIVRATQGLLAEDDILLPEEVIQKMVKEITGAKRLDLPGTNHYSILFQPNTTRDEALLEFLND
jgi:pimeloyl-ACP methyl ester carboxylesterase